MKHPFQDLDRRREAFKKAIEACRTRAILIRRQINEQGSFADPSLNRELQIEKQELAILELKVVGNTIRRKLRGVEEQAALLGRELSVNKKMVKEAERDLEILKKWKDEEND